jgi:hypothetical protein
MDTFEEQNVYITKDQNRLFWDNALTGFTTKDHVVIKKMTVYNVKELYSSGDFNKTIGEINIGNNVRLRVETYDEIADIAPDTQWDVLKKI